MDERVRQRAGVSWALGDLDGLLARGVIDAATYDTLRRDYEQRLHALNDTFGVGPHVGEPTQGALPFTTAPPVTLVDGGGDIAAPPVAVGAATPPIATAAHPAGAMAPAVAVPPSTRPAAVAAPHGRAGEVTGLWINLTLFLGAFFVVMASLIFVISSWRSLGAGAKAAIMVGFTAAFIGSGLLCLRLPRVRPAGQTFLGIGAILLPLDIVGAYNFFLREQGLSLAATWAFGAAICAAFYGALALRRVGRVYAVAALLAAVASWWGALVAADLPRGWFGPAFLMLPLALLVVGRLCERSALGRATFGALPAWLAQGLIPLGLAATVVGGDIDRERVAPLVALSLGIVIYTLGALTQPQPTWRGLHVAGAGLLGAILLLTLGWWAAIPVRGYAALALGGGWLALIVGVALRRLGPAWHWGAIAAFAVGWVQIGALLLPWGYFVPDDAPLFWTAIFGTGAPLRTPGALGPAAAMDGLSGGAGGRSRPLSPPAYRGVAGGVRLCLGLHAGGGRPGDRPATAASARRAPRLGRADHRREPGSFARSGRDRGRRGESVPDRDNSPGRRFAWGGDCGGRTPDRAPRPAESLGYRRGPGAGRPGRGGAALGTVVLRWGRVGAGVGAARVARRPTRSPWHLVHGPSLARRALGRWWANTRRLVPARGDRGVPGERGIARAGPR